MYTFFLFPKNFVVPTLQYLHSTLQAIILGLCSDTDMSGRLIDSLIKELQEALDYLLQLEAN